MARQIIILEQRLPADPDSGGEIQFRAVFWLIVPAARVSMYVDAAKQSQVKDGSVIAGELTELQAGRTVEVIDAFRYPNGTAVATIQADMVVQYAARQTALNNETRLRRYGSSYDGTTWTLLNKV